MNNIARAYRRYCRQRFPLPSDAQVCKLERDLGVGLPSEYRRYLLEFNGAYFTEPQITPKSPDCPVDRLTVMAGLNAPDPFAELGAPGGINLAFFDDNDPPQVLPIAYTMMGHLIFMVVAEGAEDNGNIALKLMSSDTVVPLAYGIDEFFGLLVDAP
jgi:hypothetical protein